MVELECIEPNKEIDIMGISQTRWKANKQRDTMIPGYKLYHNDRIDQFEEGMVLYVKENIQLNRIKVLQKTKCTTESFQIEIPCAREENSGKGILSCAWTKFVFNFINLELTYHRSSMISTVKNKYKIMKT